MIVVVQETKDKEGTVLSRLFYAGYKKNEVNGAHDGIIWSTQQEDSYQFESLEFANNWVGGEGWRLGGAVVREL